MKKEYKKGLTSVSIGIDDDYEVEYIRVVDLGDLYVFDITPNNFDEYKDRLVETTYLLENGYSSEEYLSFDDYLRVVSMQDLDKYSIIILWKGKNFNIVYDADSESVYRWHKRSAYYYLGTKGCLDKADALGIKETDEVDDNLEYPLWDMPYFNVYRCGTAILDPDKLNCYSDSVLSIPPEATTLCGTYYSYKLLRVSSNINTILMPKGLKYVIMYNKEYDSSANLYGLYEFLENFGNNGITRILCSRNTKFINLSDTDSSDKFKDLRYVLKTVRIEYYD